MALLSIFALAPLASPGADNNPMCRQLLIYIQDGSAVLPNPGVQTLLRQRLLGIHDPNQHPLSEGEKSYLSSQNGLKFIAEDGTRVVATLTVAIEGQHAIEDEIPRKLYAPYVPAGKKVAVFSHFAAQLDAPKGIGFALILRAFAKAKADGAQYAVFTGSLEARKYYGSKLNMVPVVKDLTLPKIEKTADLYVVDLATAYDNVDPRLLKRFATHDTSR